MRFGCVGRWIIFDCLGGCWNREEKRTTLAKPAANPKPLPHPFFFFYLPISGCMSCPSFAKKLVLPLSSPKERKRVLWVLILRHSFMCWPWTTVSSTESSLRGFSGHLPTENCFGASVTTVDSGSKALEVLGLMEDQDVSSPASTDKNQIEVNLVITDYCMPGMTGYDLLKKIKGSSNLKGIPVVIMSSENVPSRINRCLEGGAEEFFLKPIQVSDMIRLRLYMLKGRLKEQQQSQQQENNIITGSSSSSSSSNSNNSNNINKRKAMDGGLSPEKRRPRFSCNSLAFVSYEEI